jgi:hypothetical protein
MSRDKSIKPWSSVEAVQSQQLVRLSERVTMSTRPMLFLGGTASSLTAHAMGLPFGLLAVMLLLVGSLRFLRSSKA